MIWQPIETFILPDVANKEEGPEVQLWDGLRVFAGFYCCLGGWVASINNGNPQPEYPTHWAPLLARPASQEGY